MRPGQNSVTGYTNSTGDHVMRRPLASLSGDATIKPASQGYGMIPGGKSARRLPGQTNWESTHYRR